MAKGGRGWVGVVAMVVVGTSGLSAPTTTASINPRSVGLALALDDGTRKVHSVAENTKFVAGFFRGVSDKASFAKLTAGLYFVYEAMESTLDGATNDKVKALDFPELRRTAALERDMKFYYGDDWKRTVEASPATRAYVARIKEVGDSDVFLAHLYSRYLGDLFGGQMMSSMASKSLGLVDGLGFYTFDHIPDTKAFITHYYAKLNGLGVVPDRYQALVDEANLVFYHNIQLFNELQGNPLKAVLALAWASLTDRLFPSSSSSSSSSR